MRKLASAKIAAEKPGLTLQPTALVHEAYLRLIGTEDTAEWQNRAHFFAAAAEAMRRILIENARRKSRVRHGGEARRIDILEADLAATATDDQQLLELDEALERLATVRRQAAELVKLRSVAPDATT